MGMKGYYTAPEPEPDYLMQFSVIPKASLLWEVLPSCRGYSQRMLNSADMVKSFKVQHL